MKPAFKTTAIALLVAFGSTGCLLTSDNKHSEDPKPIQPSGPIKTPPVVAKDDHTNSANRIVDPKNEPEKPNTDPENVLSIGKASPDRDQDSTSIGDAFPTKQRFVSVKVEYVKSERKAEVSPTPIGGSSGRRPLPNNYVLPGARGDSGYGSYDNGFENAIIYLHSRPADPNKPVDPDKMEIRGDYRVELNLLAKGDNGEVVEGKWINSDETLPSFDYIYVNQPYSSYGQIIHYDEKGSFELLNRENNETVARSDNPNLASFVVQDNGAFDNKNVSGEFNYQGNVISNAKIDGKVNLDAKFDKGEVVNVKGEVNSNTVGVIHLNNDRTVSLDNPEAYGFYHVSFGGKEMNDMVGRVRVAYGNPDVIINNDVSIRNVIPGNLDKKDYLAVFGGTKTEK